MLLCACSFWERHLTLPVSTLLPISHMSDACGPDALQDVTEDTRRQMQEQHKKRRINHPTAITYYPGERYSGRMLRCYRSPFRSESEWWITCLQYLFRERESVQMNLAKIFGGANLVSLFKLNDHVIGLILPTIILVNSSLLWVSHEVQWDWSSVWTQMVQAALSSRWQMKCHIPFCIFARK